MSVYSSAYIANLKKLVNSGDYNALVELQRINNEMWSDLQSEPVVECVEIIEEVIVTYDYPVLTGMRFQVAGL